MNRERWRILRWKVGGTIMVGVIGWLVATTFRRAAEERRRQDELGRRWGAP